MLVVRQFSTWITLLMIFLSRLPFIGIGYGSEEDAWGLRLTAEKIYRSGLYEVSRLPGHPFQELLYSQLWQYGPICFNLLTLIISTAGIAFFIFSLKKLNISSYNTAGIALAFTPVIYINSMNAMDYTWAMAFVLIAFYFLISCRMILAGIFLGCAIGCRITSGAMLIPFIYYVFANREKNNILRELVLVSISTLLIACLLFTPVFFVYGFGFFTYYEHFEIPSFTKNFYKGTLGAWGLIGFVILMFALGASIFTIFKNSKTKDIYNKRMLIFSAFVLLLYTIAFCRLPLKSAFLIPLIPFVILIIAMNINKEWMAGFAIAMIISGFAAGVNLSDQNRGSAQSGLALIINVSGQQVSIDPLVGPVMADYTKQKRIINFSREVVSKATQLDNKSVIISGWYLNFILSMLKNSSQRQFVYYINELTIKEYLSKGYNIYYLPDQNKFNDLRFKGAFTNRYAKPFN